MRASTSFACVIRLSLRQLLGGPIARHIGILKLRDSRVPRDAEAQPFVRCVHQNHPCHLVRISRGKVPHSRTTVRVPHEHERAWLTEFGEDLPQFRDSTVKMFLVWGRGRSLHIRPDLARARGCAFHGAKFSVFFQIRVNGRTGPSIILCSSFGLRGPGGRAARPG
jgi:hypothetical protein